MIKISVKRIVLTIVCAFVILPCALGIHFPQETGYVPTSISEEYFIIKNEDGIRLLYDIVTYNIVPIVPGTQRPELNNTLLVTCLIKSNTCQDIDGRLIIADSVNGMPVDDIDYSIFKDNQKITSVKLPNSLRWIEMYAFSGCTNLTSVSFPKTLKQIKNFAFEGCSNLTHITLDTDGELGLGYEAFKNCEKLESITLPASFGYSGPVFNGCTNLKSITLLGPNAKNGQYDIFEDVTYNTATLYVPFGMKAEYESRSPWKYFKNIVEMEPR